MEIPISTKSRVDLIDITAQIQKNISVSDGLVLVYTPHTTTGVFINEDDPGLVEDVLKFLGKVAPQGIGWKHDPQEGNADAHLRGILLGNSVVVPVTNGKMDLGTWQHIFFYEGDGPRSRRVVVKGLG